MQNNFIFHLVLFFAFFLFLSPSLISQKVLQIERYGKAKTEKIYIGQTIFIQTKQHPDYWLESVIEDMLPDAQAIVLHDRIIQIKDITAMKFRKVSKAKSIGRSLQYSAVIPAVYEVIFGSINPPIDWRGVAIFSGGAFTLGSLARLLPPKKIKFGNKKRLRVLDLTFYKNPNELVNY